LAFPVPPAVSSSSAPYSVIVGGAYGFFSCLVMRHRHHRRPRLFFGSRGKRTRPHGVRARIIRAKPPRKKKCLPDRRTVDRIADRFFSDGRPVYPAEVERVLMGHPSIADAGVAQVGAEDGRQVVAAVVVPAAGSKTTEHEILAFARQHLESYQAPALVTFVDQLPRSSVGKLVRAQLRAVAAAEHR